MQQANSQVTQWSRGRAGAQVRELEARFWEAAANAALAAQERWAADAAYSSVSAAPDLGAGGPAGAEARSDLSDAAKQHPAC